MTFFELVCSKLQLAKILLKAVNIKAQKFPYQVKALDGQPLHDSNQTFGARWAQFGDDSGVIHFKGATGGKK